MDADFALTIDYLEKEGENIMGEWGKQKVAMAQEFNSEVREAQQHVARKTKLFYQHANNFSNAVKTETEKCPPSVRAKVREKSQELKGTLWALNRVRDDPPSQ
ncbi:hypothetical protein CDV36_000065 [Fusarium kuroshium]|uniref:Uncharacterized protein n=1 Tax=Fusarium kuroshium TaxID=2010991 RepID=A0A3M2SRR4_9HYPO|nr:hypothetical protein CDV36_000065 [Fusarium kuroshium]